MYSGMKSIHAAFSTTATSKLASNFKIKPGTPINFMTSLKANGVAVLITMIQDHSKDPKPLVMIHKPSPASYDQNWKTHYRNFTEEIKTEDFEEQLQSECTFSSANIDKALHDELATKFVTILNEKNQRGELGPQQAGTFIVCSLRGELCIDKDLQDAINFSRRKVWSLKDETSKQTRNLTFKIWNDWTSLLKDDYKHYCVLRCALYNRSEIDGPTSYEDYMQRVQKLITFKSLFDVSPTDPKKTLQTLSTHFPAYAFNSVFKYDATQHILTTVPMLKDDTISFSNDNDLQQQWNTLKSNLLQLSFQYHRDYQCEGFVTIVSINNEIIEKFKVKPYFVQIFSPFFVITEWMKSNAAEKIDALRKAKILVMDSSLCNLFQIDGYSLHNPTHTTQQAQTTGKRRHGGYSVNPITDYKYQWGENLDPRNYDKITPNALEQIEQLKNQKEVCKMFLQNMTGSMTSVNSWKNLTDSGSQQCKFFSTQQALLEISQDPSTVKNMYCALSWWDKGHVPRSNQLLIRTKSFSTGLKIFNFSKITRLNKKEWSCFDSLLCEAQNANGVEKFETRNPHFHNCFIEKHESHLNVTNHFKRTIALQFLFVHLFRNENFMTKLYTIWPCLPSMVRHSIVALFQSKPISCTEKSAGTRPDENHHPLRSPIALHLLALVRSDSKQEILTKKLDQILSHMCKTVKPVGKSLCEDEDNILKTMKQLYITAFSKYIQLSDSSTQTLNEFMSSLFAERGSANTDFMSPCMTVSNSKIRHLAQQTEMTQIVEKELLLFFSHHSLAKKENPFKFENMKQHLDIYWTYAKDLHDELFPPQSGQGAQAILRIVTPKYSRRRYVKYAVFGSRLHSRTVHGNSNQRF